MSGAVAAAPCVGLPVLTYHSLDSSGSVISTHPYWFAQTMAALADAGYTSVALDEWVAAGRPVRERTFALAFDDGLHSIRRAADVLSRHGFVATAFLVTGRMGGDNAWPGQPSAVPRLPLVGWSELSDQTAAGFRFGSHTQTHQNLSDCDAQTLESDLAGSRAAIEDRTGQPCTLLAYPYGSASALVHEAAARHYSAAFGTRLDFAGSAEHLFALSRIDAYYLRTPRALQRFVAGRWQQELWLRRGLREARQALEGKWSGSRPRAVAIHKCA